MDRPLPSRADLAILGGGINGAGLAALAARAGLSVVLFEKGDFASGTSSKSTKLIHGGIRYLEQARFTLVFEALHERRGLMRSAPHLVHPLAFLLPVYAGDRRPPWMLKLGLWLYDLLAGAHNIGRHRWLSPEEALREAPALRAEGLRGCGLYYDAQVNDARLVLENILAAEEAGAWCRSRHEVTGAEGSGPTRLTFRDRETGQDGSLEALCVVNASGPWANRTDRLFQTRSQPLVRPSRGSHLVVDALLKDRAVLITTRSDNRVIFVIPWRGSSLVGTTDLDDAGDPDKTRPTEDEIAYLLEEAARLFPGAAWDRSRVLAAFSGLRPLAWAEGGGASSVSREDRIQRDGNRITIVGGKLTTYRAMAKKALREAAAVLGRRLAVAEVPLPGAPEGPWEDLEAAAATRWPGHYGVPPGQALHLARLYGRRAQEVLEAALKDPLLREPLHPDRPELLGQVAYAVTREKALHLSDVMLRRLEIGYTPQRLGEAPEKASRLMARLLGWDEGRRLAELEDYRSELEPPP